MLKQFTTFLSALVLFTIIYPVYGLSSDNQQPITMQADVANLNRKTGISVYQGHVKLIQGTTVVTADTIITYTDSQHKNKLQKAIAYGKPASYTTLPDDSKLPFNATALTIEYYPQEEQVKFIDDAKATQGQDSYAGPQINYDIVKQIVTSPASNKGHTTIIIHPEQSS